MEDFCVVVFQQIDFGTMAMRSAASRLFGLSSSLRAENNGVALKLARAFAADASAPSHGVVSQARLDQRRA